MKIPDSFIIGPFTYFVNQLKNLDCLGQAFLDRLEIQLKIDLPKETKEETFLHEVIHTINHVYCSGRLKEREIRQLSIGMYQFLKDNNFLKK